MTLYERAGAAELIRNTIISTFYGSGGKLNQLAAPAIWHYQYGYVKFWKTCQALLLLRKVTQKVAAEE